MNIITMKIKKNVPGKESLCENIVTQHLSFPRMWESITD